MLPKFNVSSMTRRSLFVRSAHCCYPSPHAGHGCLFSIGSGGGHGSVNRLIVNAHRRGESTRVPTAAAKSALTEAKAALKEANAELEKAKAELEKAEMKLEKAKTELEKAKSELHEVKKCGDINAIRRAEQNCDAAQEGVSTAQRLVTKLTNELPAGREHLPVGDAISLPHTGK